MVDSFPDSVIALDLLEPFLYPEFEEISGHPRASGSLAVGRHVRLMLRLRQTHTQLQLLSQTQAADEGVVSPLFFIRFRTETDHQLNNIITIFSKTLLPNHFQK